MWFDHDVQRLNYDEHGQYLGEFHSDDLILVILDNGEFYTTNFDLNNHYEQNILRIEKFDPMKVWTAALFDAEQGYPYLKRFPLEASTRHQNFLGENPDSRLLLLTDTTLPQLIIHFAAPDDFREPMEIDAEQFIGLKSFKAKGKRITTLNVERIEEKEVPEQDVPEDPETPEDSENSEIPESPEDPESPETPENPGTPEKPEIPDTPDAPSPARSGSIDPLTGQFNLFEE